MSPPPFPVVKELRLNLSHHFYRMRRKKTKMTATSWSTFLAFRWSPPSTTPPSRKKFGTRRPSWRSWGCPDRTTPTTPEKRRRRPRRSRGCRLPPSTNLSTVFCPRMFRPALSSFQTVTPTWAWPTRSASTSSTTGWSWRQTTSPSSPRKRSRCRQWLSRRWRCRQLWFPSHSPPWRLHRHLQLWRQLSQPLWLQQLWRRCQPSAHLPRRSSFRCPPSLPK